MVFGIQGEGAFAEALTAAQISLKAVSFNIIRSTEWRGNSNDRCSLDFAPNLVVAFGGE
jgi:hypothetical protein